MQTASSPLAIDLTLPAPPHFTRPTYLMCPPQWYDIDYVINPWMAGNLHRPSRDRAFTQWRTLFNTLREVADVHVLPAEPGCPDMVFIAHTAAIQHGIAVLSSFAHRQRQPEERYLRQWLETAGFLIWETPRELSFEGEGDAVFDSRTRLLWMAHGVRTCQSSQRHLADAWHVPVRSLRLVDPRFYHLDTCFATLSGGHVLYFPEAFDSASRESIESVFPEELRIAVSEAEATRFVCSAINIGRTLILGEIGSVLERRLSCAGYDVCALPLGEFLCGGGSARSMVLRLSDSATGALIGLFKESTLLRDGVSHL